MKPLANGKTVEKIIPGLEGGTNWFPPAYDPSSGVLFVAVNQWGMGLTSWEKGKLQYKPGDVYQGVDYQMYRMGDTIGHLKAIDIANKKVLWDVPSPLPFFSGMLATKGGVVFTGDQRGRLLAYDSKTGKELWKFQTGLGDQRFADHLRARRKAICRDPVRTRRRSELLLFGAEGRHALGVRDRRQGG